ncbi:MAG: Beta-propeller repeat-containing protein [Candidatus Methanomarinus sp.]|nr:MAG: Beta-propeller repeat-containing protein [ANME-2 cluster archaeon]
MIRKKNIKLNKNILILLFLGLFGSQFIVIGGSAITQMATVDWYVTFGYDDLDQGYSCAVDSYGNAYVAGDCKVNGGNYNATLIKYDQNGIYQWNLTWGGQYTDQAKSVYVDSLDNLYLAGKTYSLGADTINGDAFIAKYDNSGILIWNRTWGADQSDYAGDVYVDSYGNVHVVCTTSSYGVGASDVAYLRYNSTGYLETWSTWGGTGSEQGAAIEETSDHNYIISGSTTSFGSGNTDAFILCYDVSGTFLWNTTWGTNTLDRVYHLALDSNNSIYLAGWTYYPSPLMASTGIYDISYCLVKIDSEGNAIWSRFWGSSEYQDYGTGVAIDSNDNIYFVGEGLNGGWGVDNVYMAKFNTDGVLLSETTWGGGHYENPHSITIDKTTDDIFVAGDSSSFNLERNTDILLIKNPTFPAESSTELSTNDTIPGFSLFILISITTVIALVIIKKKFVKV